MTIRYRKLDANGDYTFGQLPQIQEFWIDQQEAVAQAILTRLQLTAGEWFLDLDEGTPYNTQILGFAPPNVRDFALRSRILDTIGVNSLTSYQSSIDQNRACGVTADVDTIYGQTSVTTTL